jgi:ferredoxin-type protein NapH
MTRRSTPGADAIAAKGWVAAQKWLLLRRATQVGFLALFLAGPLADIWIVEGTLSSSLTLGVLPLSDPYLALQSITAGHAVATTALIGAAIVLIVYALLGGRLFCSFVCPMNIVTDGAHFLARRLDLPKGWRPRRDTRLWLLAATFIAAFATGTIAFELINPVSMLHRGLIFGMGAGWAVIGAVFLFDLLVSRRGWCGHLCPVGAFYGLVGVKSLLRISAAQRSACNDCLDCFAVCPEPQVIAPALHGATTGVGPVITARDCTNCGRCIDVCAKDVFKFDFRFNNSDRDVLVAQTAPSGADLGMAPATPARIGEGR